MKPVTHTRRRAQLIAPVLLGAVVLGGCMADLRRGDLRSGTASETNIRKGRELVSAAVEKHGGRIAWEKNKGVHVRMRDTWKGLIGRLANPWPLAVVNADMSWTRGTYSTRVTFRQGELKGTVWGLKNMKTYQVDTKGKVAYKENQDQRFIITALLYLTELPFRLPAEATRIAYMGREKVAGKQYDLVMMTWGKDFAPSSKHDQYVLWIGAKSGLVEKSFYTVRDIAGFAVGCMHYDDYRKVDGILFPYVQTVTSSCKQEDYRKDYLHQVIVESVRFDAKGVTHAPASRE